MAISAFIRFEDDKSTVLFGEPALEHLKENLIGASVEVLNGDPYTGLQKTGTMAKVVKVSRMIDIYTRSVPSSKFIGLGTKSCRNDTNDCLYWTQLQETC